MEKKYDLMKMLDEIKQDESEERPKNKVVSQNEIKEMLVKKRKKNKRP